MSSTTTVSATHITTTTPVAGAHVPLFSIRHIVRSGILAGATTAEMSAAIRAHHPGSAAARIPNKHIAWYRADMKKRGELPTTLLD